MFHFHSPVAKQKGSMPHHSMAVNNIIIFNYPWIIGAFRLIVASHPIAFAKEKKFQNLFKRKGNRAVFKQIISPLPKKFSLSLTRRRVLKNQRRRRRQISLFIANIKMFTLERVPANRESNNNRNINSIMITRQDGSWKFSTRARVLFCWDLEALVQELGFGSLSSSHVQRM